MVDSTNAQAAMIARSHRLLSDARDRAKQTEQEVAAANEFLKQAIARLAEIEAADAFTDRLWGREP